MIAWATPRTIRAQIAEVTKAWLIRFAHNHPESVRKLGKTTNCKVLFSSAAILQALERGE